MKMVELVVFSSFELRIPQELSDPADNTNTTQYNVVKTGGSHLKSPSSGARSIIGDVRDYTISNLIDRQWLRPCWPLVVAMCKTKGALSIVLVVLCIAPLFGEIQPS